MDSAVKVDLQKLWEQVVSSISTPQYGAFLSRTKPLGLLAGEGDDGSNLLLSAPDLFTKDVLETRLRSLLTDELTNLLGEKINIAVTVTSESKEEVGESNFSSEVDYLDPVVDNKGGTGRNSTSLNTNESAQLNPRYIFETFVIGASNRFAHAAAVAVAEAPAKAYNPLFIYGESGLGKTHLAQAIGNEVKRLHPNKVVLYVSSEKFINQFMDHSRNNAINDFIHFYQLIDVLILDDVQFFAKAERSQDAFFAIFNHLHQSQKQLVLTSDKSPKDLEGVQDRLLSRFRWGLSADLQVPDYETRIEILEKKMRNDGLEMPKEVVKYIAYNINNNVRELEGALISLLAQSSLNRKEIDLDLAKKVLRNFVKSSSKEITIDTIQKMVETKGTT